jgi:transcriptional regulator with XRE-family HTH domain
MKAVLNMTSLELKEAMESAGLSVADLAEKLGRSKKTVYRWLSGETPVPPYVKLILN